MTRPFDIPNDSLGVSVSLFFPLRTHYSLVSCCQDPGSPLKVEGELPEEGVGGIFGDGGKPCPGSVVMEMGEPEVLFDDISDLRDGLMPRYFEGREASSSCGPSHDAVGDGVDLFHAFDGPVLLH